MFLFLFAYMAAKLPIDFLMQLAALQPITATDSVVLFLPTVRHSRKGDSVEQHTHGDQFTDGRC